MASATREGRCSPRPLLLRHRQHARVGSRGPLHFFEGGFFLHSARALFNQEGINRSGSLNPRRGRIFPCKATETEDSPPYIKIMGTDGRREASLIEDFEGAIASMFPLPTSLQRLRHVVARVEKR